MADGQISFTPLPFRHTTFGALRPPLFDGDFLRGTDYASGQLLSLAHAKDSLLFTARFGPGPDAAEMGWSTLDATVQFLLLRRAKRYIGAIADQTPAGFLEIVGQDIEQLRQGALRFHLLDGLGQGGAGLGGRHAATFFCWSWVSGRSTHAEITVTVYFRLGLFGGWKDVVIKLPKKELYIAEL